MSVYVDPLREWGCSATWRYPQSCHLMADTLEELHDFAARLGLKREWFQSSPPHSVNHYDLTRTKRIRAVQLGAIQCNLRFRP